MNIFDEEQEHLSYTLQEIEEEIIRIRKEISKMEDDSRRLTFEDKKRGAHFQINGRLNELDNDLNRIIKACAIPYFGRIDISLSGEPDRKIYIGRVGISSNNQTLVTDWRSPVCSLYYDSELGKANYDAYGSLMEVVLKLKRQINIKNGKLIDAQDASLVVNDDLLKPYLSANADNKMKIIVASIQKEQNNIIRKPAENIIVQGVAGSGKTSVALHRIAYLIYNMSSDIKSDQFLILGPNNYFLNYISSILPELETSTVNQETLVSLLNSYVNEKYTIVDNKSKNQSNEEVAVSRKIESFKSSLKCKDALNNYIRDYLENELVTEDFVIDGDVVFTKEDVKKALFSISKEIPSFDITKGHFITKFKSNIDEILKKISYKYEQVYLNMSFENPERRIYVDKKNQVINDVKKNGLKYLDKYFKEINKSPSQVYLSFINNIEKYQNNLSETEIDYLKKTSVSKLNKKKIGFEDIPSLMHIYYHLTNQKLSYKQIVIDEAQDYGLFHFDVLKEITNDCIFSIYGDLAQSIYSYRSINNWEDVNNEIFDNTCEMMNLSKSYRTTIEITENANSVLEELNLPIADPVIRHGKNVMYSNNANDIDYIYNQISEWLKQGYTTSAVICKTDSEVNSLVKKLQVKGLDVNSLTSNDKMYEGSAFVLTSASAKGLEFDTVIINDASDNIYSGDSDVDMHLLYVASTRALHEQIILYDKRITPVYEKYIEKPKIKTMKI